MRLFLIFQVILKMSVLNQYLELEGTIEVMADFGEIAVVILTQH